MIEMGQLTSPQAPPSLHFIGKLLALNKQHRIGGVICARNLMSLSFIIHHL
jgi:hypothetical protein